MATTAKPRPCRSRARRFDAGIDRQDVGLECDGVDDLDDVTGARGAALDFAHRIAELACGGDALACTGVGAGGDGNDRLQLFACTLQSLQQAAGDVEHRVERRHLRLRLRQQFVVVADQVRHFGRHLHRQRHGLSDRLGQVTEAGGDLPRQRMRGLRVGQGQIEVAAAQQRTDALQQCTFGRGIGQALREVAQRRRHRDGTLALGQSRGVAQQGSGFRMRQRQQPAFAIAVGLVADAAGGIVAGRAPAALFVVEHGSRQAPQGLAGLAEHRVGQHGQQIPGRAVGGHHTGGRVQAHQTHGRVRQNAFAGHAVGVPVFDRCHVPLLRLLVAAGGKVN